MPTWSFGLLRTEPDAVPDDPAADDPAGVRAALRIEQRANLSTDGQWGRFEPHRRALTAQLLDTAASSLCVLGAGNCNDLDLEALARHYAELHLVDLDDLALARALSRQTDETRSKLTCHTGFDLSGVLDKLPRWSRFQLTPEELMASPAATVAALTAHFGRQFDRVVSPCVLTQLQLAVVRAFGSGHRLLQAVTHTITLTHLRCLAALTRSGGRALLVTELSASDWVTLAPGSNEDWLSLVNDLDRGGHVIAMARPTLLRQLAEDDPVLRSQAVLGAPHAAWLWPQSDERTFLAYASWLKRLQEIPRPA